MFERGNALKTRPVGNREGKGLLAFLFLLVVAGLGVMCLRGPSIPEIPERGDPERTVSYEVLWTTGRNDAYGRDNWHRRWLRIDGPVREVRVGALRETQVLLGDKYMDGYVKCVLAKDVPAPTVGQEVQLDCYVTGYFLNEVIAVNCR